MAEKSDFYMTRSDQEIMSYCLKHGYKVYPIALECVKKRPSLRLEYSYNDVYIEKGNEVEINPLELTFAIMKVYKWIYTNKLQQNLI